MLSHIRSRFPWHEHVCADAGYDARQVKAAVASIPVLSTEIVRRSDGSKGFLVQPRRGAGSPSALSPGAAGNRRLAKDYENLADTLAAFIDIASIRLALSRIARPA